MPAFPGSVFSQQFLGVCLIPDSDFRSYAYPDDFHLSLKPGLVAWGPDLYRELFIGHLHVDLPNAQQTKHVQSGVFHTLFLQISCFSRFTENLGAPRLLLSPVPRLQAVRAFLRSLPFNVL